MNLTHKGKDNLNKITKQQPFKIKRLRIYDKNNQKLKDNKNNQSDYL